jgi:hypothetical protein
MRHLPRNYHTHEHGTKPPPPGWMLFPALTVLPFLRGPLGYEMVHPRPGIVRALKLIVLPACIWWVFHPFIHFPANLGHMWMMRFAAAGFVLSLVVFLWRAFGPSRGEEVHTAEAGYSWLSLYTDIPMPLCELVIVPGLLAVTGYALTQTISFELGWWLILSGASYLVMAAWEYRRRMAQQRATIDDKIRAQMFGDQLDTLAQAGRVPFWRRWRSRASQAPGAPDRAELGGYDAPPASSHGNVVTLYSEAGKAGFP